MQNKHPKGLITASLTNMGERFGFYIMMGILLLFLQAKFGLSGKNASIIYSIFYASVYVLALVGGIIADRLKNYKGTILVGLVVMTLGYVMLGIPTPTAVSSMTPWLVFTCFALFAISFGNGLFKGNLQALVGRMYDNDQYRHMRDTGFSLFYMFINIGAVFAPLVAVAIRNWWLQHNGFVYNANLPEYCHQILNGTLPADRVAQVTQIATEANGGMPVTDLSDFALNYVQVFSTGFHYAFLAAVVFMLISLIIYLTNKSKYPADEKHLAAGERIVVTKEEIKMSASEIKTRILALCAVFGVVIFFWMSFHQNGVSLTQFAKHYVNLDAIKIDLGFTTIVGAEIFQSINPLFVVTLTPLLLFIFGQLKKRNMEPSTPKKIVIGMFIAALAFVVMAVGSKSLPAQDAFKAGVEFTKVSPWLMVLTYFILTLAELFISPMGISFVSKVAPPHLQGIMQGLWLCATAVGNSLLFVGMILYESLSISATWIIFACACGFSMLVMLLMVRWLEKVAD